MTICDQPTQMQVAMSKIPGQIPMGASGGPIWFFLNYNNTFKILTK